MVSRWSLTPRVWPGALFISDASCRKGLDFAPRSVSLPCYCVILAPNMTRQVQSCPLLSLTLCSCRQGQGSPCLGCKSYWDARGCDSVNSIPPGRHCALTYVPTRRVSCHSPRRMRCSSDACKVVGSQADIESSREHPSRLVGMPTPQAGPCPPLPPRTGLMPAAGFDPGPALSFPEIVSRMWRHYQSFRSVVDWRRCKGKVLQDEQSLGRQQWRDWHLLRDLKRVNNLHVALTCPAETVRRHARATYT